MFAPLKNFFRFISSLKLTVVLLTMGMILVFIGTIAQVKHGLWDAQTMFFRSIIAHWELDSGKMIPVFPGGYLLGWALFINLISAHVARFKMTWKKSGIFLTHIGLLMLLLGQFLTERLQVESHMRIEEGWSKNYSAAALEDELAVIDKSGAETFSYVSFPGAILKDYIENDKPVTHSNFPFEIRIKKWFANSEPLYSWQDRADAMQGPQGLGARLKIAERPVTKKMDDRNIPAAMVEVVGKDGDVIGEWLLSGWLADDGLAEAIRRDSGFGERYANLDAPQEFEYDGKTWEIALRTLRYYKGHEIYLHDFKHDRYLGTDKAKNFSSRITLNNPEKGEERELTIRMNEPLRYAGETYFQGSFEKTDKTTILQVVMNPAWLTPYVSCTLIGIGLCVQFGMSFMRFRDRSSGPKKGGDKAKASKEKGSKSQKAETAPATADTKKGKS